MSDLELQSIAENAKLIINGYSFTIRADGFISILNLNHPECAIVFNNDFEIIETNMDEIEQNIVKDLSKKNIEFLENENA